MRHIYLYRMTSDTGNAPCLYGGILTLACCKPDIRRTVGRRLDLRRKALPGEERFPEGDEVWVGAAIRRRKGGHTLVYLARIDGAVPVERYFGGKRWRKRPDCIYEPWEKGFRRRRNEDGTLFNPAFHPGTGQESCGGCGEDQERDLGGEYVLWSEYFVYLGRGARPLSEELLSFFPKNHGYTCHEGEELYRLLMEEAAHSLDP